MEQFIREKIKDKPLNKKDLQKKLAQQHSAEWHLPVSYTHLADISGGDYTVTDPAGSKYEP